MVDICEHLQNRLSSPIYHQPRCSNNSAATVVPVPFFGNFSSSAINLMTTTQPSPEVSSSFLPLPNFSHFKIALNRADSHLLNELALTLLKMSQSAQSNSEEAVLDALLQRLEFYLEHPIDFKRHKLKNSLSHEHLESTETLQNLTVSQTNCCDY